MTKWFLILAVFPLLSGCKLDTATKGPDVDEEMIALVNEQRAIWDSANIRSYMFSYFPLPSDCGTVDPFPDVVITVEEGEVSSVYVPTFGTFVKHPEHYPTIDGVFDQMLERLSQGPIVFGRSPQEPELPPEFHAQYGFPLRYHYDQSSASCDGGRVALWGFQ